MTELAVITPTYRVDAEIFDDLHRSVLEFTPDSTVHHVFVPKQDRHLFTRYEGARCRIWTSSELLPPRYCAVPGANMHVNVRQPWPLVRGWVMQQAIKIAAAAQLDAKVVVMADSDVVLVRPVRAERFVRPEGMTLFRAENAVTPDMRRHVHWHQVARDLLGLPPAPQPPLPDYISPLNFWQPATVREMQVRIADVKGRAWLDAFTSRLHVSEYILYGVFVDEAMNAAAARPPADTTICHNEWQRTPLDHGAAEAFANRLGPDAVAVMISAKSRTPNDVRQAAIRRCTEIVRSG
jgi:Family of unknown function (DUF6492)